MEDGEMYFTVLMDDGEEVLCEILFTFESEMTNKKYIVYTDSEVDDEGNTKVYASVLSHMDGSVAKLLPIETEREWCIIETILDELKKNADDE